MARDSEKRFHSIMDKLFRPPHSPSSSGLQQSGGKKRPYSTALGVMETNFRGDVAEGQQPICRPWDRGDFIRRLATFKSMLWFAKPEAVSAVNCARRGWINVDVDTIACEACGARILFSAPASWNQQQVEKAALVFSLKLDSGHKLLCPWVDNACDETVARFPPTPPPVLIENFKERCSALLQLSALPQISSSAIKDMKSPLLEEFLVQPLMLEGGNESASSSEIENVSSQHEMRLYYQAQKLISLCGWKPRTLPYLVDCKGGSTQSDKSTTKFDSSQIVANNNSLIVHSANIEGSLEAEEKSYDFGGEHVDPKSVVLNCDLCGATVGLWAFCTVARPVESFRLVGYTEVNGENESGAHDSLDKNNLESRQLVCNNTSDVATSSKDRTPSLNMTIAGGPPPTRQNFKATISLPVIGQNLRARLSYDSDFRNHINVSGGNIQSNSQNMRFLEETDSTVDNTTEQIIPISSSTREGSDRETTSPASIQISVGDGAIDSTQSVEQSSSDKDKMLMHTEADGLNSLVGDPRSSQKDLTEGEVPTFAQKNLGGQFISMGKDGGQTPSDKANKFDPIRQHRHFCPWIASIKDDQPGWLQVLSALCNQKSSSSPNRSPSSTSILKVDDPIGSVRKLFMSPSKKRMKLNRLSDQSTEHR